MSAVPNPKGAADDELADRRARKDGAFRWHHWKRQIPARHPQLPSRARHVVEKLVDHADVDTGHSWSHLKTLSSATGLSERTVQRAIADLKVAGLVKVRATGRERIDFWLQPFKSPAADAPPCQIRSATVAHQVRQVDASATPPCQIRNDTVATLTAPGTTPSTEPPQPPTASGGGSIAVPLSEVEFDRRLGELRDQRSGRQRDEQRRRAQLRQLLEQDGTFPVDLAENFVLGGAWSREKLRIRFARFEALADDGHD